MYNEVFDKKKPRKAYHDIITWANSLPYNTLIKKKAEAENLFTKTMRGLFQDLFDFQES